jgi:hypothetical protein
MNIKEVKTAFKVADAELDRIHPGNRIKFLFLPAIRVLCKEGQVLEHMAFIFLLLKKYLKKEIKLKFSYL